MTQEPRQGPVLVTGFEPFEGRAVNASWSAVRRLPTGWGDARPLVVERLPVSFLGARRRLRTLVAELAPAVVLLVGESGEEPTVRVERTAVNVMDARIPDNDGYRPTGAPVIAGAAGSLRATLPVEACLAAARATGVATEPSDDAGTYVCNATFYALMHLLAQPTRGGAQPGAVGGFVHVPRPVATDEAPGAAPGEGLAERSGRVLAAVLGAALR